MAKERGAESRKGVLSQGCVVSKNPRRRGYGVKRLVLLETCGRAAVRPGKEAR
jgi:hypothetical protein